MSLKFECDRCGFQDAATAVGKVPRDWQILNGAPIWMRDTYLCPSCWKLFQVWLTDVKSGEEFRAWIEQEKAKLSQQTLKADVSTIVKGVELRNPRNPVWGAKFFKDGKWQQYVSFTVDAEGREEA